ncbi:protein TPR3-like [Camellia sinensis]|uniref:protein TPR3-like n=1 Tax=Camellia sinensis TaxID=4442 RepID=UPI001035A737|nr:protein TPR3-like [Camellia sinensis]
MAAATRAHIEAHIGSVSDIAFASISEQISIVIGGDDKTIKVWDVVTGANLFTFKGHETPLDITKDHFLAAGDDYVIKFWEMDSEDLLATSDARGDLPLSGFETPYICFNKEGTLLAASARNKRIKILGTLNGIQSLQAHEMPVSIIATKFVESSFTVAKELKFEIKSLRFDGKERDEDEDDESAIVCL